MAKYDSDSEIDKSVYLGPLPSLFQLIIFAIGFIVFLLILCILQN